MTLLSSDTPETFNLIHTSALGCSCCAVHSPVSTIDPNWGWVGGGSVLSIRAEWVCRLSPAQSRRSGVDGWERGERWRRRRQHNAWQGLGKNKLLSSAENYSISHWSAILLKGNSKRPFTIIHTYIHTGGHNLNCLIKPWQKKKKIKSRLDKKHSQN